MPVLLIVDDEEKIRQVIREYAEFHGFTVLEAQDGMEAVNLTRLRTVDLILMDVMMPRLDGYSATKEIRRTQDTPIIMLTARGEEFDKLFGFELGVDDYVTKPFSPKELMARIQAVLKRSAQGRQSGAEGLSGSSGSGNDKELEKLTFQGLVLFPAGRTVTVDGARVDLTPKEYDLLLYLIQNRNIALSREKLLSQVWGYEFFGDDRTVDTHIKNLRNSLGPYRDFIVTLRGVGYKFEAAL